MEVCSKGTKAEPVRNRTFSMLMCHKITMTEQTTLTFRSIKGKRTLEKTRQKIKAHVTGSQDVMFYQVKASMWGKLQDLKVCLISRCIVAHVNPDVVCVLFI